MPLDRVPFTALVNANGGWLGSPPPVDQPGLGKPLKSNVVVGKAGGDGGDSGDVTAAAAVPAVATAAMAAMAAMTAGWAAMAAMAGR